MHSKEQTNSCKYSLVAWYQQNSTALRPLQSTFPTLPAAQQGQHQLQDPPPNRAQHTPRTLRWVLLGITVPSKTSQPTPTGPSPPVQ